MLLFTGNGGIYPEMVDYPARDVDSDTDKSIIFVILLYFCHFDQFG